VSIAKWKTDPVAFVQDVLRNPEKFPAGTQLRTEGASATFLLR